MPSNTYFRAAAAATGLLASTVSAAFNAGSSSNVAVYWGQGYAQLDLSEVCSDDSVDIVNLAFVNQFPKEIGQYPATNFANACGDQKYLYPDGSESGLLSNCPGIEPGIKKCQANGKKVLLSIGGGWPTDYYLESTEIAEYFAEFLWGAFGPQTDEWVADGKPRPFGDAAVDGFDLDIESWMAPAPFDEYMYANYGHFVSHLKNNLFPTGPSTYYISSAPQCVVPDIRLADAIATSSFDFIFIQFYNTPECSSRAGYNGLTKSSTTFTLDAWVEWLTANSANPGVKVYIGLPANEAGAPSDIASYLKPAEAEKLISHYAAKHSSMFGGVMLWEASLSARNEICSKSYGSYIKDILVGDFTAPPTTCPSSSSSVATATSTSTQAPQPTGGKTPDGSCGGANGYTCFGFVDGECCSQWGFCGSSSVHCDAGCQEPFGNCGSASSSSSVSATTTSVSSSSSSVVSSSSSSASATSTVLSSSSSVVSSSSLVSSSSSAVSSSSSSASASSSAVSSTESASSSASASASASSSAVSSSSAQSSVPYPTGGNSTSAPVYPTGSSSDGAVYPTVPYPTGSNHTSNGAYPTGYNTSTPCTTSTALGSEYPTEPSSTPADYPEYPASSSAPYPTSSAPADYPGYPVSSPAPYPTSSAPADYSGYPASSPAPYPTSSPAVYPSSVVPSSSKGYDVIKTVITTSYVDICPTGLTTVVTKITKTVCPKCETAPTTTGVPEGWYTTVTVCTKCGPATTTVTLTKPYDGPQPTGGSYVPEKPEEETYVPEKPEEETYVPEKPEEETYVPEKPEEYNTKHATSTVVQVITLTKVPIPATSAPGAPYVPANSTNVYAPTGSTSSTGYGSYPTYIPSEFEGAASRFSVGMSTLGLLVAAVLAM